MNPEWWGTLGVGGLLAGVMFYFYRADRKLSEQVMLSQNAQLVQIIEANTRAMTALTELVRSCGIRGSDQRGDDDGWRHDLHQPPHHHST